MKRFIFIFIININVYLFSQVQYDISYGNSLNLTEIDKNSTIKIFNNNKLIYQGNSINEYIFNIPGQYNVNINEYINHNINRCEHKHLPENFIVNVAPYQINFVPSTLKLSEDLIINKDTSGIKIFIDVEIQTFDNNPLIMNEDVVKTAGVGTNIYAKLDNNFTNLDNGKHSIFYNLEGLATQPSYIMFDFIEPNGNIQSVALLNPIKNK